ncbi:nuclear transport factor 2 family protein [Pseudoalteromonas sp. SR43-7]|uniref:nuclear transport factor 2 family protein n=1 Tax=Pseudoalteromonas sp. SR43-7 TaxID=2760939 RepID=UPI0015F8D427|nr:nuclear transport factor 2 family protein [Pseudoalteromonas sp. SR43-7]MBB1330891.1 nuclear transport factor 2 family protein [Pseudoalteromonas sp. SR43-7]
MKPLSIILASLVTTVALITYAAEQKEPQVEAQASVEKPKVENEQSVTQTNTDDKVNTLEYKAPELKKPTIDATKPDDSKVLGDEQIKPAEKPKNKIEKAVAVAEAEKAVTQAKEALTVKQQTKAKQSRESLAVVEQLVKAYNARNIEEFLRVYAEDVEFYIFPNELLFKGKEKLIERYGLMFKKLKCIHSSPIKRIVHGDIVIDHELSETCSTDENVVDKRSELISSYQIKDGKIVRVLFFR